MRAVRAVLIGKSDGSIDRACRRYGFKIPLRERKPRRVTCPGCRTLIARDASCPVCASGDPSECRETRRAA